MSAQIVEAALARLGTGSVIATSSHTQNLRWANSALTTNGDSTSLDLSVVASVPAGDGLRTAAVSGQVDSTDQAVVLADRAVRAARQAPVGIGADLPVAERDPDFDDEPTAIPAPMTEQMVDAAGLFCRRPDPQFGYAELDATTTYLGTTAGTHRRHTATTVRFEGSARSEDGHRSAWWGTNDLSTDFPAAADHLAERLEAQRSRGDLEPGRHRVILSPSAVADLMIFLAWSANGRDAVEGHNVFSRPGGGTRIGEALTPRAIDLVADPHHPGLATLDTVVAEADSSAESVYDNGLPIGRTALVEHGRLSALRASRVTAARFGLSPAYLAQNLIMVDDQGHGGTEDLIARTEDAVLITCLWYIREVDPQNLLLTGLTRDGVYRVRDGVVTESLPNFRFNVSVTDVLARIADASSTVRCLPREWADWVTRTAMPALLVDGFNLSSRSEAL